jgi:IS4 transposase
LDLRGNLPAFIHISDGKCHGVNLLDHLMLKPGAFYVMDRAYLFARLYRFQTTGSFFVTRAKSSLQVQRRYSRSIDRSTGLICDHTVMLAVLYSRQEFDARLRPIRFKDPETRQMLIFLTNNFTLPTLTSAQLYRQRWQIELFFKWIKQHFGSRLSLEPPKTRPIYKSGSPSRLTCSSPTSSPPCLFVQQSLVL